MILFFDTETTGKADFRRPPNDPVQPRIVQLVAMLYDDARHPAGSLNVIIRPDGFEIPAEASAIHGITTEYAKKYGVPLKVAVAAFESLFANAQLLVAHNIDFDRLMVRSELARIEAWNIVKVAFETLPTFCTMKSTTDICKLPGNYGYKWPKLQEAHVHFFGEEFEGAHDAMADVRACAKVYFAMHPLPKAQEDAPTSSQLKEESK